MSRPPPAQPPVLVLVVTRRLGAGGTERHLLDVLPRLDRDRVRVSVYAMEAAPCFDTLFRDAGIAVETGPAAASAPRRVVACARAVRRLLAGAPHPCIAHFFLPEPYLAGGFASLTVPGVGRVMSRRSLNRYQLDHPLAARAERWLHRRMDAVLGNSAAVLRELVNEGVAPARCARIDNGIDLDRLKPRHGRDAVRRSLGVDQQTLVLLTVANLHRYKGHADLLHACALAAPRLGTRWRLLCAGRDEGELNDLKARSRALGIEHRVGWLGERDDVPDLLGAADLFVHPSHEEGSPNAVLEAMAAGLPVVVTDAGGSVELVRDGETGRLVAARAPAAFAGAMVDLALDPGRRRTLGEAGAHHVRAHHSLDATVAAYEALYAALAAGRSPTSERL